MIVAWSRHTGAANEDRNANAAIRYLCATGVIKEDSNGRRTQIDRDPPPEILRGDPALVSDAVASLDFQHIYASAVLSFERADIDVELFHRRDADLRSVLDLVMEDFEATFLAGIPAAFRPPILWTSHTHTGRMELNVLIPRGVMAGAGKVRAINPHPPGDKSRALSDAFRDVWNQRMGWADPEDQSRRRLLKLPHIVLKRPPPVEDPDSDIRPFDDREMLDMELADVVERGWVRDRTQLVAHLEAQGYTVRRKGKDYITVIPPGVASINMPAPKAMRMRGILYDERFTSVDWLKEQGFFDPLDRRPRLVRVEAERRLDELRHSRAEHHRKRLHGPGWYVEDLLPSPFEDRDHSAESATEGTLEPSATAKPAVPTPDSPPIKSPSGDQPPGGRGRLGSRTHDPAVLKRQLWESMYDSTAIPAELVASLHYVDPENRTVTLKDRSRITDLRDKLRCQNPTATTVRLMFVQAAAKGWERLKVAGDETFVRMAAMEAEKRGVTIVGDSPATQEIIDGIRNQMDNELPNGTLEP